jgi:hypothetical protein
LQSAGDPKAVLTDIALGAFAASLAPLAKFMNDKNITNFAELRAAVFDHFKKPGCGPTVPPVSGARGGATNRVVIGENMERVEPYAKEIGAGIYPGMPDYVEVKATSPDLIEQLALEHNRQWIVTEMENGSQIIDIGPDFARRAAGGASPAYEMERSLLSGYTNYVSAFARTGNSSVVIGAER